MSRTIDHPERGLLCDALVEREREMALLLGAVDRLPGCGGLVVLAGEAGVGKTRLLREAVAAAEVRGVKVLTGRAVPTVSPVPYRPLSEAALGAFRSHPGPLSELAGFGGQVARLVPEWQPETPGGADESPVLLGEAVVRLVRAAGGTGGSLLALEDLHWADAETLGVVEYLADGTRHEPVLCVCTVRPEGSVVELLARLRRHPDVTVVGLHRLGGPGIDRMVADCLAVDDPPAEVVEMVASASEGNPFLLEELLAGLVASDVLRLEDGRWVVAGRLAPSVPFDFATSVRERLAPLGEEGRRVIRAAALLGRRFDWELLPGLVGVDGRTVLDALRVAVDEQLVAADGEAFRFRHALTREAVVAELLAPERRELARRALPAVEGAHPGFPGGWCELAADLAAEAGDRETAARHLVESARRAVAGAALTSAEAIARRARKLAAGTAAVDDAEGVLIEVLAMAGKTQEAADVGERLVDRLAARRDPDVRRVVSGLVLLARASITAGDVDRADVLVVRARSVLAGVDEALAARLEAVAGHVSLEQGAVGRAAQLAHTALELARASGQPEVQCEALEVLGRCHLYAGDSAAAKTSLAEAVGIAEQRSLTTWLIRARHELALLAAYVDGNLEPLHDARELAARSGALVSVAVMDLALAEIALGDFDRAACLEHARRSVEASHRYRLATLPVAYLWLAGGHALAGDVPAMEEACRAALEPDPEDPRILGDLWGRVRATWAMVEDDRDELRRDLDTMMRYVRVAPITTSIFPSRVVWALVHTVHDDDHGEAARAEVREAMHLRAWPFFDVALAMIDAVALGRSGRAAEAAARYDAVRWERRHLDEGFGRYVELLVAEAAVRDGWGDPVAGLRATEAFFGERDYDRIARRCRAALAAAGAPVPRRGRGDSVVPEALRAVGITSRELDVLRLVADGLSNREVAARLHLSPRTVERHISNLFDRTGYRSRGALAELLRQLDG